MSGLKIFFSILLSLPRRTYYFIVWCVMFFWELSLTNYQVAKLTLSTSAKLNPGFVSVPLTATSDFEITSFANAITLTPGTISVHIPADKHCIIVHALDVGDDVEALRQSIKDSLEIPILRFTR